MTQFNHEQQLAINALGQNVIVSASAGAGKTTVLVARLMKRILKDSVKINAIVAMTFTEAAAGEMKIRLLKELNKAYSLSPTPFLQEQIAMVETAQITTIHSFCLTLIKNYGYVLGLDPLRSQNILDEAQVKLLQLEAYDRTLQKWLSSKNSKIESLLEYFSSNPLDFNTLFDMVEYGSKWLIGKKNPDTSINEVLSLYQSQSFTDLPQQFKDIYLNTSISNIDRISDSLRNLVSIMDSTFDYEEDEKMQAKSQELLQAIGKLSKIRSDLELGIIDSYDNIASILNIILKGSKTYPSYNEQITKTEKVLKDFTSSFIPLNLSISRLKEVYPTLELYIHFLTDFIETFRDLKRERQCYDFSDFEYYGLEILRANDYEIAKKIRPLYEEIMVDEFQDTNEYQDEIIQLISNGSNIFRVGDIKQSIYRFRGAKPSIMKNLIETNESYNLSLSYNYRSKKSIVSFNNFVFSRLMNLTQGMTYTDSDHVNTGVPSQNENSHPVEFHIIEKDEETPEEKDNQLQAKHIAQQVIHFHQKGYSFKDMVVLVRGHSAKAYLKEAFEMYNIPHFIDDRAGFYNSEIVKDVYHFLNFANNNHDYYLTKVLLSNFIRMSADEVATLRLYNPLSLKESLKDLNKPLYDALFDMIRLWKHRDIVSIIQDIATFNNTYHEYMSLQDKTNFDYLLEKAALYQETNIPTLSGFINFIKAFENDTTSEASSLSSEDDVVTAMTIHKSKGLQFPVVFVWGMPNSAIRDHSKLIITDENMGIGMQNVGMPYRIVEDNFVRLAIEEIQIQEEIEEGLRLLYVALTRPQNHLVIVDVVKNFSPKLLDYELLRKHKRKSELLYAAAPKDAVVLNLILPSEIEDSSLEAGEIIIGKSFEVKRTLENVPMQHYFNPALDINKYSKGGMAFGTILHEAIETLPHRKWNDDDLVAFEPAIKDRLKAYNSNEFTQELYGFDSIFHETSYMGSQGEGIIDFYATKENRLVLVDFKSDAVEPHVLVERYKDQVSEYKEVLLNAYPNYSIETFLYSFKHDSYIKL